MITLEYIRHFRFFDYAIFDLVVSFLGMYLLSYILSKLFLKINISIPKVNWIYLTLPIGIIVHLLVGTITPMTRNFIDLSSNYILKIIIIFTLILGLRGIKIVKRVANK